MKMNIILYVCQMYLELMFLFQFLINCKDYTCQYLTPFSGVVAVTGTYKKYYYAMDRRYDSK